MKILILNYEFPPLGGGAGKVAQLQAQILSKHHQVCVLTSHFGSLPTHQTDDTFEIFRVKSKRKHLHKSNVFEMLSWMRKASQFCDEYLPKHHYHLVIAHFTLPGGELAFRLFKKFKIPYWIISHGHDIPWFFPKQMWHYHLATYFRIRQICKNAQKTIVLSENLKQNAQKILGKYGENKIEFLPNAIDEEEFPLIINRKNDSLKILFIGRLVEQKNPLLMIEALHEVFKNEIPFVCHIIGNGPLFNKIQNKINKYKLQKHVVLRGWLDKDEIIEATKDFNLFILPSRIEAMSIAILEALFAGMFVITTKEADTNSLITEEMGSYFENNNPEHLAAKIMEFNHKYIEQKSTQLETDYHTIRANFGIAAHSKKLLKLIDSTT